ncbi:MAG: lamin tail domain-containing protein [Prevotella sp.]|nr:lamin tail domain-containing protein [Prevotella sp.]
MLSSLLGVALVINELMASNAGSVMSPAYNFDSWIELYNPTEQPVNLSGMYLSNDAYNLKQWRMPSNVGTVPAKGYLVVWLGSDDIKSNQAPFKLDCDGGVICLSDRDGQLVTSVEYPEAMSRTSWARTTDGGDEWGWTANATPGASNATSVFATERLDAPVVSEGSQLLNGSLTVKVDIPEGATLMYTTDGSMPVYTPSGGSGSSMKSKDGLFTVTKTTNYVFRLFRDGYLPSVPVTRSYIQTHNNFTIPVVSIVGDERYFTDAMWGIDVKGNNGIPGNGRDDAVNWNQPWDRPVNFSYISPTDGMLFNQDVNISVSGGWSRMSSPRSMKLKSNKVFDGLNHLDYAFFPQKPNIRSKVVLVRNGGNDSGNRFMDPALTTIVQRSGIDLDVQSLVQVAEFINGRFKGVLNLREPNNDKYVYANYGYDDEEIDMFENKTFTNGTNEVYRHLCDISENINDAGVYDEVKTLLDIDEFTNYMAAEIYLGNDDWPDNNVKAYRSQDDGRFRFILFDLDQPFNAWGRSLSTLESFRSVDMVRLFLNLLKHDEYRKKFIDTFCILAGSVFEKNRATAIVNELADAMRPMLQLDGRSPDGSASNIKNNLANRLETMVNQLQQYRPMQLTGVKKVSLQVAADTKGANILVNGINVPYGEFNGRLFAPVSLEAKAPAGYTFAGWRKLSGNYVPVFGYGDTWRYYDNGEAPSGWKSYGFNQSSWKSGAAPLGYSMAGIKTTVGYGGNPDRKNPTTYFRKTFTLNADPNATDLFVLNYKVDDGCIVWVNSQEAGRVNMRQGSVGYDTFSSTYAAEVPLEGSLELNPSLFRKGGNVIAIEVHNTSYTSSDLYWDCELLTTMGTTSDDILPDPVIDLSNESKLTLTACFTPLTDAERKAEGYTPVCINEVSAANSIYVNEFFKHNDWVELYNTTDSDIDIAGMYLSDDSENPKKYQLEKTDGISTVIPAHGFLTIWCDKVDPLSQLHASFKLNADGGEMLLTAADESWCDRFTYGLMEGDETVGRYPDGSRDVFTMNVPTIGKANILGSYSEPVTQPEVNGICEVTSRHPGSSRIYNIQGQAVQGNLPPGIYIQNGRKFIKK